MNMENTVLTRFYDMPPVNRREILRYAGCAGTDDPEINAVFEECLSEIEGKLSCKVCFREFEVKEAAGGGHKESGSAMTVLDLGFAEVTSAGLALNLRGCGRILLFAATIGFEIDRLIAKASRLTPSKALFFQSIGAERIESLCDMFCTEMREEYGKSGLHLRPRFSPGYGDLPLSLQKDIFAVLDCQRKIGVTLNDSLLMSPSKSVTAVIGITDEELKCGSTVKKCETCTNTNCAYRER